MTLLKHIDDLNIILIMIYCFVDDFLKGIIVNIRYALERPGKNKPPIKKHNLSLAELISLAIFRFFTGHRNWKDFYRHVKTYHQKDFPDLPKYGNFLDAVNKLSSFANLMLNGFMTIFQKLTGINKLKFADSTKLEVCRIKREFSHKVCFGIASKSKSSMGWFYGFRLHIICNELMQILKMKITTAAFDERKGLEMMWHNIFGMIIADAGYVGKNWFAKARGLGKHLFTAVKANMKKLMTDVEWQLLKMRQYVETVFSVLKLRLGMETTLPRSPLGYMAHYLWCLTAYQLKKFFELLFVKPLLA
jgi:transposase